MKGLLQKISAPFQTNSSQDTKIFKQYTLKGTKESTYQRNIEAVIESSNDFDSTLVSSEMLTNVFNLLKIYCNKYNKYTYLFSIRENEKQKD